MFTSSSRLKTKMPKFLTFLSLFCVLCLVECERTRSQIYIDITAIGACFRRLNATNQIGCSSSRKGNVGVVHYIKDHNDLNWLLEKGPHSPYVALINQTMFTRDTISTLKDSGKVNGMLVYYNETDLPAEGFSADDSCPNHRYSLYKNDDTYEGCQKVKWNPFGEGLLFMDLNIPVVAVKNISDFITIKEKCYEKFNEPTQGQARNFPLCAALVKDAMDAAKDTPTCIRRSNLVLNLNPDKYCDPLGDHNVFMTTRLLNNSQPVPEKEIVMAATKLDGLSMFDNIYPNIDGTLTGFVTLLGAAHALSQHKDTFQDPMNKPIMFTFFQGEVFDYIGSTRMVYDMMKGNFPFKMEQGDKGVRPLNVTHFKSWLEISQVGRNDSGKLWLHSDPRSRTAEVQEIVDIMTQEASASNLELGTPPADNPLPPASLQSFLKKHKIPGVVLAEHQEQFVNKYYNSRFDVPSTIHHTYPSGIKDDDKYDYVTDAAKHLANVSTLVARTLYQMSTNETAPAELTVEPLMMTHMLHCFINDFNCSLFRECLHPKSLENWKNQEINLYVGVSGRGAHLFTRMIQRMMAYWWGTEVPVPPGKDCATYYKDDPYYIYFNISGPSPGKHFENSSCFQSLVNLSLARSPAFDIDGYDWSSNEYSSWSESIWAKDAMKLQIFLLPDPALEVLILCLGIAMFVLSLILAYCLHKRAPLLFTPSTRGPFE